MNNDEAFAVAAEAVESMYKENKQPGPDFRFPFDKIWSYATQSVPSTTKPHQARRLVKSGYLEKTGAYTQASSELRASSATPEYRFGPRFLPSTPKSSSKQTVSEELRILEEAMESDGYIISAAELANFYLALHVSSIVILSGITGTGKSLLPRSFAKWTRSRFFSIPVQPQWDDNSDLFGYVPSLNPNTFVPGRMIGPLRDAYSDSRNLVIVLLDEMNLAPVEHYFSDALSIAETRTRSGSSIRTDTLPITLPPQANPDPYQDLRNIGLPANLRIVGTANMDETTRNFSPKVLDRAFVIEFDDPDLTQFAEPKAKMEVALQTLGQHLLDTKNPINVLEAKAGTDEMLLAAADVLADVQAMLRPAGIKFGYRSRDAILMYLFYWRELGLSDILSETAALDFCLLQKIAPKIQGSGELLSEALKNFGDWCANDSPERERFKGPFTRTYEKLKAMQTLLDKDGVTYYWGV